MSCPPSYVHPLPSGTILPSLGGHFTYRIVGPCCRLFDREQLPWPCCRLQWRGKEPSWRRIGRRFTPDLAAQRSPSYAVEILEPGHAGETVILTVYCDRLTPQQRDWWYSKRKNQEQQSTYPPQAQPQAFQPPSAQALHQPSPEAAMALAPVSTPSTTAPSSSEDSKTHHHHSHPPDPADENGQDKPRIIQYVLPL